MIPPQRQISQLRNGLPLESDTMAHPKAFTHIYDDDGTSYSYENGAYTWCEIHAQRQPDGTLRGITGDPPKNHPMVLRGNHLEMDDQKVNKPNRMSFHRRSEAAFVVRGGMGFRRHLPTSGRGDWWESVPVQHRGEGCLSSGERWAP